MVTCYYKIFILLVASTVLVCLLTYNPLGYAPKQHRKIKLPKGYKPRLSYKLVKKPPNPNATVWEPEDIGFTCGDLNYTGNPVSCVSRTTFFTGRQILDNLRGKWIFFIGDSSTRGLVLPLITLLDNEQTHPYDMVAWYNITDLADEESVYGKWWRGHGGDFFRLDYLFRKETSSKEWNIAYKKASFVYHYQVEKRPTTGHIPDVFLPISTVTPNEVRISYFMARHTVEIQKIWNEKIPGTPDIVYANIGAWGEFANYQDILHEIDSTVSQFVWGTWQFPWWSPFDRLIGEQTNLTILDRTRILRTSYRRPFALLGVHYAHVVNFLNLMELFKLLGWKQKERDVTVEFDPFCAVKGNLKTLYSKYKIKVPMPNQRWKSAWKLPCRYTVH